MSMNNPWNSISPPSGDVSARRIDHKHPLDLFWARDFKGCYLFVCEVTSETEEGKVILPELAGIQATFRSSHNKTRLVLILKEKSNWEIFFALCNDLVQATRSVGDSTGAVKIIHRRLMRWHDFLKQNRPDIMPEEKIKGLIGELLFITKYLIPKFGVGSAISFWIGPEGAPQDFNIDDSAIEVKCQAGGTLPHIRITSADQLSPQLPKMYLYVLTLGKTTPDNKTAITLPVLINKLRSELQSTSPQQLERFNDLIYGMGYFESDRYLDFCYVLTEEQMFEVIEGFPRICACDLHEGIVKLTYNISISECIPFEKWPEWMEH